MNIRKYLILLMLFVSTSAIGCFAQFNMRELLAVEDSEITFASGIRAELKKGTKLITPLYFNGPDVNVTLLGAANFEVLIGYYLTVEYNKIIVKATGASFSISEGKGTIEVTASESKILIQTSKQEIVVRQFQKAVYNVSTKQLSVIDSKVKRA